MTEEVKVGLIYKKILAVMSEIQAIEKERKNVQQGYNFRGIDDVYNMVQPLMAKHGIFMRSELLSDRSEERTSKGGATLIYRIINMRYSFICEDGSFITTDTIGEGMDSGDKAGPKAMSIAQKYAILQVFMIPTVDPKDSENDSPEPQAKPTNAVGHVTNKVSQPAPAKPMTELQATEIMEATHYLMTLNGKTEDEMLVSIRRKLNKKYGLAITDLTDLTEPQAQWLIDALYKAIQAEGQRKINEIADKVRGKAVGAAAAEATSGEPGGPNDPSKAPSNG